MAGAIDSTSFTPTLTSRDITVVISVKDRLDDLKLAIASVQAQSAPPREIIVVDDCSSIPVVADELMSRAGSVPIRVHRHDTNLGGAAALNSGLELVSTRLVAFLDSDDCFASGYLSAVAEKWTQVSSDTVIVVCSQYWCDDRFRPYRAKILRHSATHNDVLEKGNFLGGNSAVSANTSALIESGGFPPLRSSFDWGMLITASRHADIQTIDVPLVYYRSPSTSKLPNLTRSGRNHIGSALRLYRSLSAKEKALARRVIRRRIGDYVMVHKSRMFAISYLMSTGSKGITKADVISVIRIFFGFEFGWRILRWWALLRVQLSKGRYPQLEISQ